MNIRNGFGLEDYSVSNRGLGSGLVGTSEQVSERIAEFEAAGVGLLLLQCSPEFEEMERFAETVIRPRTLPTTPGPIEAGNEYEVKAIAGTLDDTSCTRL